MPDSTSPEPNLPAGWLAASSAFDDEAFGDDTTSDAAGSAADADQTPPDSAVVEQFELVRAALNTPLDVPEGLLRAQIDLALDHAQRSKTEPAECSSITAPVIPLKPRRERSSRWLAAAASVAIVGAGLLAINQTINQGSDDTARDAAVSSESSNAYTSTDPDLAEKSADDSAGAGGVTNDQPLESSGRSATDMDRAESGAGKPETAAQDSSTTSAPAPVPALGDFTDDRQLMLAIAQLDASRIASAPSPAASEATGVERPAGGAPSPTQPCAGDPSDIVVGQATVAGVATLVIVRDNQTRFINLVTCVARAAPTDP